MVWEARCVARRGRRDMTVADFPAVVRVERGDARTAMAFQTALRRASIAESVIDNESA